MPKRKQPRDFYTDWELWEMDGKLHVQLTGEGWVRAIAANKNAEQAIQRAQVRARRPRRDGEAS
jgi:hypothetical protein